MEDMRHSGFTLFELLVALTLVALLAGFAVPGMLRFIDTIRLRSATEALVQDFRDARNRALTSQKPVFFSFLRDTAGNWCYVWSAQTACQCRLEHAKSTACVTDSDNNPAITRRHSDQTPSIRLALPASAEKFTFRFTAIRGLANAGSIRLNNKAGEARIIVSPLGRVRACIHRGRRPNPC